MLVATVGIVVLAVLPNAISLFAAAVAFGITVGTVTRRPSPTSPRPTPDGAWDARSGRRRLRRELGDAGGPLLVGGVAAASTLPVALVVLAGASALSGAVGSAWPSQPGEHRPAVDLGASRCLDLRPDSRSSVRERERDEGLGAGSPLWRAGVDGALLRTGRALPARRSSGGLPPLRRAGGGPPGVHRHRQDPRAATTEIGGSSNRGSTGSARCAARTAAVGGATEHRDPDRVRELEAFADRLDRAHTQLRPSSATGRATPRAPSWAAPSRSPARC